MSYILQLMLHSCSDTLKHGFHLNYLNSISFCKVHLFMAFPDWISTVSQIEARHNEIFSYGIFILFLPPHVHQIKHVGLMPARLGWCCTIMQSGFLFFNIVSWGNLSDFLKPTASSHKTFCILHYCRVSRRLAYASEKASTHLFLIKAVGHDFERNTVVVACCELLSLQENFCFLVD